MAQETIIWEQNWSMTWSESCSKLSSANTDRIWSANTASVDATLGRFRSTQSLVMLSLAPTAIPSSFASSIPWAQCTLHSESSVTGKAAQGKDGDCGPPMAWTGVHTPQSRIHPRVLTLEGVKKVPAFQGLNLVLKQLEWICPAAKAVTLTFTT